jgi:6-phosphogluconate dehydrogenase
MMIPFFTIRWVKHDGWRKVVASCALVAIPAPLFGSTLNRLDTYTRERLQVNVIQGIDDFFNAYTSE